MRMMSNNPTSGVSGKGNPKNFISILAVALLSVLVLLCYLPVLENGFVNRDDALLIANNPHIRSMSLQSLGWMLSNFYARDWLPLTWYSLAVNFWMGGLDPRVYHLTNVFLHVLGTILVFLVCLRILALARENHETSDAHPKEAELWAAFFVSLLFGLHPIHVESVAWASERKDVLYALFYLSSLYLYLGYAPFPGRKGLKLAACFGLFLLALLSKPMAVSLPIVFLILDGWPLRRFSAGRGWAVLEKIPFLIAVVLVSLVTAAAHKNTISDSFSWGYRIMNAFRCIAFYMVKMLVPLKLSPFYPFPPLAYGFHDPESLLEISLSVLLVALVSLTCFRFRKKAPWLLAAWLFYLVTLAPVLGFLQVGNQAAADRFTYLASLALFLPLGVGITALLRNRRILMGLVCAGLALLLGCGTVKQIGVWKNSQTLWESAVRACPEGSSIVHSNLAFVYESAGMHDDALREYDQAIAIPPPDETAHNGKGTVLLMKGKLDEALAEYKTAISLNPAYATPHLHLWFIYDQKGMNDQALDEIQTAIRLDPSSAQSYNLLGASYEKMGRLKDSVEAFQRAYTLDPGNRSYLLNLAAACKEAGNLDEAMACYQRGMIIDPSEPAFPLNLGALYLQKGMYLQAIEALQVALNLDAKNPDIARKLAMAYKKSGQNDLARQYEMKANTLSGGGRK